MAAYRPVGALARRLLRSNSLSPKRTPLVAAAVRGVWFHNSFYRRLPSLPENQEMEINLKGCGKCLQQGAPLSTMTSSNDQTNQEESQAQQQINRRTELDFEELRALQMSGDIALIDVRHPTELENYGEIPGAVKIPLCEVKTALQLPEDQWQAQFQIDKPTKLDRNLIFYARGPNASIAAVEIAHRLGYKRSRHYIGGWEEYSKYTGQPLKKPQKSESYGAINVYHDDFNQFFL